MRRIRFWAIAIISFFSIAAGTIWHRFLAVSLCTVLGFHSTACFVGDSGRVNAAVPPVVWDGSSTIAQNIDIFRNDGGNSPPPQTDIFNNPNPQGLPQPGVDIFNNPTTPQIDGATQNRPIQGQPNLTGSWLYSLYRLPSDNIAIQTLFVKITQSNEGYRIYPCEDNCINIAQPRRNITSIKPVGQSTTETYGDITVTTTISADGQIIWGDIRERTNRETIFFIMEKQDASVSMFSPKRLSKKTSEVELVKGDRVEPVSPAPGTNPNPHRTPPPPPEKTPKKTPEEPPSNPPTSTPRDEPLTPEQWKEFWRKIQSSTITGLKVVGVALLLYAAVQSRGLTCRIYPTLCARALFTLSVLFSSGRVYADTRRFQSAQCGQQQVSGGQAGDRRTIQLNANRGKISVSYDMKPVPDRLQVIYEGKVILDTGFVSDVGSREISFSGNSTEVIVTVTGNPSVSTTEWDYTLSCPQ